MNRELEKEEETWTNRDKEGVEKEERNGDEVREHR